MQLRKNILIPRAEITHAQNKIKPPPIPAAAGRPARPLPALPFVRLVDFILF
jgi:hypothetical protein